MKIDRINDLKNSAFGWFLHIVLNELFPITTGIALIKSLIFRFSHGKFVFYRVMIGLETYYKFLIIKCSFFEILKLIKRIAL